jgi:aspartate aminotransferase
MRSRINGLRQQAAAQLSQACPQKKSFQCIAAQKGMFSIMGLTLEQARELRSRHHIYMTDDSRINIAGLRTDNLEYFVRCVAQVVGTSS